jgi:hypothetical protein
MTVAAFLVGMHKINSSFIRVVKKLKLKKNRNAEGAFNRALAKGKK